MRNTWFKSGLYNAICDRCGWKFKNTDLQLSWDGLQVCSSCWESRHPQEMIRPIPDQNKLPWTRPEPTDIEIFVMHCTPNGISAVPGTSQPGCMIPGFLSPLWVQGSDTPVSD